MWHTFSKRERATVFRRRGCMVVVAIFCWHDDKTHSFMLIFLYKAFVQRNSKFYIV